MSTERSTSSLRGEFRAIFAVYVFSALLPLLAGFACSGDRNRRLDQRERANRAESSAPTSGPVRPSAPAQQG